MTATGRRILRLDATSEPLFWRLHCDANDAGWCACVAWHVDSFEGWGERQAGQNRALREAIFAAGRHDGYLLVGNDEPLAWCQVTSRDELPNLRGRTGLSGEPGSVVIGCLLVAAGHRRQGLARELLRGVLADLRARGLRRVEAHPKRGAHEEGEMWTGPEALFVDEGFTVIGDDLRMPLLRLNL